MDLTVGRRLRAYLTDWEQDCCGSPLRVGEEGVVELAPAAPWVRDLGLGPVDAAMTMHDVGDEGSEAPRRVRARLLRVQEVRFDPRSAAGGQGRKLIPGSVRLPDVDGLPGRNEPEAEEAEPPAADTGTTLIGTVSYEASFNPPPGWVSGPDGWLLDLEVLEELGPAW